MTGLLSRSGSAPGDVDPGCTGGRLNRESTGGSALTTSTTPTTLSVVTALMIPLWILTGISTEGFDRDLDGDPEDGGPGGGLNDLGGDLDGGFDGSLGRDLDGDLLEGIGGW